MAALDGAESDQRLHIVGNGLGGDEAVAREGRAGVFEAFDVDVAVADDIRWEGGGDFRGGMRGDIVVGANHDADHFLHELGVVFDDVLTGEEAGELVAAAEDSLGFFEGDHVEEQ